MSWRSLVGLKEPKAEPEQIADSCHEWQFRRISRYPPSYMWCATVSERSAFLRWAHRIDGYWCEVTLRVGDDTVYQADGREFLETSFSRALWIADRFLDHRGKLEKKQSTYSIKTADDPNPPEASFYLAFTPPA